VNELALFAGAGGGILGGKLLGWRTVCAVEWEPYPASVLVARQNDKILAPFPIWDDVRTFDGKPWQGIVDVVSGGFPCQDISAAGGGRESLEADQDSGLKWRGLLAKYDHVTRLWKTAQCSLLADLEQSLEIWPRWGLMRDGVSYQQQTLVRHTSEKESGLEPNNETFWHTPNTVGLDGGSNGRKALKKRMNLWPTVTATANQLAPSMQSRYAKPIFPTPTTGGGGGERSAERAGTGDLNFMARTNKWPTPDTRGFVNKGSVTMLAKMTNSREEFSRMAYRCAASTKERIWPTPTAQDAKNNGGGSQMDRNTKPLNAEVGGPLNPTWVEWLMGWPLEWTDLKPLETDKFQQWQQQHSDF
jgi:DNA (cytosine-5)-methyltransferase 1